MLTDGRFVGICKGSTMGIYGVESFSHGVHMFVSNPRLQVWLQMVLWLVPTQRPEKQWLGDNLPKGWNIAMFWCFVWIWVCLTSSTLTGGKFGKMARSDKIHTPRSSFWTCTFELTDYVVVDADILSFSFLKLRCIFLHFHPVATQINCNHKKHRFLMWIDVV